MSFTDFGDKYNKRKEKGMYHHCKTCKYGDWLDYGTNPELAIILHPDKCIGCCVVNDKWEKKEKAPKKKERASN